MEVRHAIILRTKIEVQDVTLIAIILRISKRH